jgi:hypothetical protein
MTELEPHIAATIAGIPDYERRELLAQFLVRLCQVDGIEFLTRQFPILAKHWHEPTHYGWPPK